MGRAPCCDKTGLNKGPWTPEEDQKLMDYIQKHGPGGWRTLSKNAGLSRCGKSCRLRWANYLRPDIKRGRFSFEEEQTILQLHSLLGNKWSAIAARLPGRTDNEIKNYWNTHIRKRLLRMGVDPATHRPRLDLSSLLNPSGLLGLSSLLGLGNPVSSELLQIAANNLLSAQCPNPALLQQNALQPQQLQQLSLNCSPIQEQSQSFFSPQNLMPASPDQLQSSAHQPNVCESTSILCGSPECFLTSPAQPGFDNPAPTICAVYPASESSVFRPQSLQNSFDFPPAFPSLVPIATPLNSSSTCINSTTTTNATAEDELDSFCSSVLDGQLTDLLDFAGGFM